MNAEIEAVKSQETEPENQTQATTPQTGEETNTQKFDQKDVERIVGERISRERAKYEKKYGSIDLDHYNKLIDAEEQRKSEDLEKRGEFEVLLKNQAEKFNSKIQQYESELQSIKVDGALVNTASDLKAVNPTQVAQLLKGQLKLNPEGVVDVIDPKTGQVRYDDNGSPLQVKDLVKSFLNQSPWFVSAGPQGSGVGKGEGDQVAVDTDTSKLDMNNPEHRKLFKQIMNRKGLNI
tara:strand:+ start:8870 stop:9574 length:705 start_codon:yes stop_codon:yes gene_type:complete